MSWVSKPSALLRRLAIGVVALSVIFPASALASGPPSIPRLPTSAADWATFTPQERDAAYAYEWSLFEAAAEAGTLRWTIVSAAPISIAGSTSDADGIAAAASVTAECGLASTFVGSGSITYGYAWVDAPWPAYTIYAGKPPVSTMNQFIRQGQILDYFYAYSYGAGRSHEYAESDPNFKWFFESIYYRTKSWMGVQRYQGGSWQLGPDAYCTVAHTF